MRMPRSGGRGGARDPRRPVGLSFPTRMEADAGGAGQRASGERVEMGMEIQSGKVMGKPMVAGLEKKARMHQG